MMPKMLRFLSLFSTIILLVATAAWGAYHHGGDTDSEIFSSVYPEKAATKLDSCALCHTGGEYEKQPGKWVALGSCQWCHYISDYDENADFDITLNPYGRDYRDNGRNAAALIAIESLDSDGDSYINTDEILANRFPGDGNDDPTKVPAPYRVYTRQDIEAMPQHTQFLLMNTHKSGDYYAEYGGVTMADLLEAAGIRPEAESIFVYAPDGWSQYHPLDPDADPLFYHVYGPYPEAQFYYDESADAAISDTGWCDYSAPSCTLYHHGDDIEVDGGLQMLLAVTRDGDYLTDGVLDLDNRLNGEGPFRVVPPQKTPGPPDQSSKAPPGEYLWPFDEEADHNAGFATRSATIIKVGPLPEGTTDIDTFEAGWSYVDDKKIVIYGAVDPLPTIMEKMDTLFATIRSLETQSFKNRMTRRILLWRLLLADRLISWGMPRPAGRILENQLLKHFDGCVLGDQPDCNDWITSCPAQKQVYWLTNEILVLMNLVD